MVRNGATAARGAAPGAVANPSARSRTQIGAGTTLTQTCFAAMRTSATSETSASASSSVASR